MWLKAQELEGQSKGEQTLDKFVDQATSFSINLSLLTMEIERGTAVQWFSEAGLAQWLFHFCV
jgi:hypothetical protein